MVAFWAALLSMLAVSALDFLGMIPFFHGLTSEPLEHTFDLKVDGRKLRIIVNIIDSISRVLSFVMGCRVAAALRILSPHVKLYF